MSAPIRRCPNPAAWLIVCADDCLLYVCAAHKDSSRRDDDQDVIAASARNDVATHRCGRIADIVLSGEAVTP